jgi:hypothetical protein
MRHSNRIGTGICPADFPVKEIFFAGSARYRPIAMAMVPTTTAIMPVIVRVLIASQPRRNSADMIKLKSGVVDTMGAKTTTRPMPNAAVEGCCDNIGALYIICGMDWSIVPIRRRNA